MPVSLVSSHWVDGNLVFFDTVTGNPILTINQTSLVIGGTTNKATFESDGTLVFGGNATTFDDLPPIKLIAQKLAGAGADPILTAFVGNTKQYVFAVNDELPSLATEALHKYKEGSDLDIHVHWATNGVDVAAKAVKWQCEYTVANGSTDFEAAFGATTTVSAETVIPANTPDRSHCITPVGTIDGSSLKIGAYIIASLKRIASTGDAPTADPFGIALGFHAEQDTTGSRTRYVK